LHSKTPYVIFQFIVFRHNEHQIKEVKKLGREIGVNEVKIKTAQIYDYINGNDRMPANEKFSRYKKVPFSISLTEKENHINCSFSLKKVKNTSSCWKMWHNCVITWDGKVVPCCFDKDAKYPLGDLKERSFKDIWFNRSYTKFRTTLLKSRKEIDICQNCSEGTKVWI
jgi:radical SAM protein with 4Fe4S-binding SPASM domain